MTSAQRSVDPRASAFLVGAATIVAQALLLRESMAAMGGSEMAWGLVMALWLTGMAVGARIGVRLGSAKIAELLPIAVLILSAAGIVLLRAVPAIIGAAPGETVTTASAVWLWILAIVPAAASGGLAFPALADAIGSKGGGRAYGFEGIGSLVGGILLTVGLLYLGAASALCLALGAVATAVAWWRRSAALTILAAVSFAASVPAGGLLARAGWDWSGQPGDLRTWAETRHQQVAASVGPPTSVFGDGQLLATYPDPYVVLPRAHLLMLLHPHPQNIFGVGCVVDGSIEAMRRHPIDRLTLAEEDPDLLRILPEIYGSEFEAVLDDPRVEVVTTDPLRALRFSDAWDLVLLLDSDPSTLRRNRTRTLEFLRFCRAQMRPEGLLVMRVGVSDTYIGGAGGQLLSTLAATVNRVFEKLMVIPGDEVFLVASGPQGHLDLDHEVLIDRLNRSVPGGCELLPEMVPLFVDRDRADDLSSSLSLDSTPNTIRNPRAILLAGALHEARVFPGLLPAIAALERGGLRFLVSVAVVSILVLLLTAASGKLAAAASAATVGFCSMGWWLLLIAGWQSTRGTVYSEIGALGGLFMAGLAVGAMAAARWRSPERKVPLILGAGAVLSLGLAAGVSLVSPRLAIPVLLVFGGALTGAAFPGLALLSSPDTRRSAGVAFAADEAGAATAALAIGIFTIPLAGLTATAWWLATLQLAAIPAAVMAHRKVT